MSELTEKMLSRFSERKMSPLLSSALNGGSCMLIAGETTRRLDREMKESGKKSFTIGDIRRIRNSIF